MIGTAGAVGGGQGRRSATMNGVNDTSSDRPQNPDDLAAQPRDAIPAEDAEQSLEEAPENVEPEQEAEEQAEAPVPAESISSMRGWEEATLRKTPSAMGERPVSLVLAVVGGAGGVQILPRQTKRTLTGRLLEAIVAVVYSLYSV